MTTVRAGAAIGLAITAVVAAWWLACMHPALAGGVVAAGTATQAAMGLWLVRAIVLAVIASRLGVMLDPRRALAAMAALVAVAWPLLVLLWAAGASAAGAILGAEAVLLTLAGMCVAFGRALAGMAGPRDAALALATAAGALGAALLLVFQGEYLSWIGWAG